MKCFPFFSKILACLNVLARFGYHFNLEIWYVLDKHLESNNINLRASCSCFDKEKQFFIVAEL